MLFTRAWIIRLGWLHLVCGIDFFVYGDITKIDLKIIKLFSSSYGLHLVSGRKISPHIIEENGHISTS
jgi:hypothetical protein